MSNVVCVARRGVGELLVGRYLLFVRDYVVYRNDILERRENGMLNHYRTDSLEMMSLDSLKRAQLKGILEQYYGAEIDPKFLFDINTTFEQLVNEVDVENWRRRI